MTNFKYKNFDLTRKEKIFYSFIFSLIIIILFVFYTFVKQKGYKVIKEKKEIYIEKIDTISIKYELKIDSLKMVILNNDLENFRRSADINRLITIISILLDENSSKEQIKEIKDNYNNNNFTIKKKKNEKKY